MIGHVCRRIVERSLSGPIKGMWPLVVRATPPAAGLLVFILSGCAALDSPEQRALRKTPSFRAGYEDGCAAANAEGADLRDRPVVDKSLYDNDDAYRAGWSSGTQTCRRTALPTGGVNPVQP